LRRCWLVGKINIMIAVGFGFLSGVRS
jgi:hypothetical protein